MDVQLRRKIELRGGSFIRAEVNGHEDERIKFSPGSIIMTKGEKPDIFYWIILLVKIVYNSRLTWILMRI